ncbi:hypothetical protein BWK69_00655 [Candidatus Parcubacteria bacterium A4]|nr:MAG: hypothetical protein BWK69_00655 [Candidatus Parcubacteria bacterium A4]
MKEGRTGTEGWTGSSIGFLGPKGTFSWKVAETLATKYKKNRLIPFSTFGRGLGLLKRGDVDKIVLPVENSVDGGIKAVLDILQEMPVKFNIQNEVILPIGQWLLGIKGAKMNNIKTIYSKQEAFDQCQKFISKYGRIELRPANSTGEAVQIISQLNSCNQAAIGPEWLTEFYSEISVMERVDDSKSNATRFIVLGKGSSAFTGDDKTSIIFTIADKSGELVRALNIFVSLGINMTKIESRPSKKKIGEYVFHVDISGHKKQKNVGIALMAMKMITSGSLKILGSYPRYV